MKPNQQRVKWAIYMLIACIIMLLLSIYSSYLQIDLLFGIYQGLEFTELEISNNDYREQVITIVYLITFIISAITFIRWFRRAYYNLSTRTDYVLYRDEMSAWCWFIPFINLWRPYQIMKDLYTNTSNVISESVDNRQFSISYITLNVWWAMWLLTNIASRIMDRYYKDAEEVSSLISMTYSSILLNVLIIFTALLAIKVIKDYQHMERLFEENKLEDLSNQEGV